jgi:hypothetical protein
MQIIVIYIFVAFRTKNKCTNVKSVISKRTNIYRKIQGDELKHGELNHDSQNY